MEKTVIFLQESFSVLNRENCPFFWGGGGTFINYNCWFDLGDDIEIGENCNIAMNVHFINGTHEIGDENRRATQGITKRIVVGAGSWIGADIIIMP